MCIHACTCSCSHACTRIHKRTHMHILILIHIHVTRHFSLKSCIGRLFGGTNEPHVWLCSRCRSGTLSELLISGSASNNITSLVSCVKIQPNTLLAHMFMHVRACMYEYACLYSCVCVRVRVCTCVCAIGSKKNYSMQKINTLCIYVHEMDEYACMYAYLHVWRAYSCMRENVGCIQTICKPMPTLTPGKITLKAHLLQTVSRAVSLGSLIVLSMRSFLSFVRSDRSDRISEAA